MRPAYRNPVLRGLNPDPSVCRVGPDYYLVTSTMGLYPGLPIHHSRDLVNWRPVGHALTRPAHFCLDRNAANAMIYAATIRHHAGRFYVITTEVHGGGNFYVTATDPAGPWGDPVFVDGPVFDPSLLFDTDGRVYYTRRGDFKDKDIVQAEIDIATGKLLTPPRSISKGLISVDTEGPHLYHIGDWYYLTMGEGGSRALHMQTIARSRGPWGPFEPCPHNPFLAQHNAWWHPTRCLGHVDLIDAEDGSWWAVFLGTRHAHYDHLSAIGRETFLAPVTWHDGWPVVDQEHLRSLDVHAAVLPPHPWPTTPSRDDFDVPHLGLDQTLLSHASLALVDLESCRGRLRLRGSPNAPATGRPSAFVGRRQTEHTQTFETILDFAPPPDAPEEAGLCVFQTEHHRYELFKTAALHHVAGHSTIGLRKTVGDLIVEQALHPAPPGPVRLRVEATPDEYKFSFAPDTGAFTPVGTAQTRLISTELAAVWSGVLIGPYARGGAIPSPTPADFDYVDRRDGPA